MEKTDHTDNSKKRNSITMTPLVTIAIPAYKAAYLRESIASALAQTYVNIEVVIVNDHSPEDLRSVVECFSDPRIRYFVNEHNLGADDPSANWNECLRHAQGEYFCLLCDDDLYAPTFVEELLQLAERHPVCDVLRSGVRIIDKEGREMDRYPSSPEWETVEDYMWHVYRSIRRQTISEFMLRRSALQAMGGYVSLPYAWGSDYLTIYKLGLSGGIASTTARLTTYRDSGLNMSSDQKNMDDKLLAYNRYIQATRDIIRQENFPSEQLLTPLIDNYQRRAQMAHIVEADNEAFFRILANQKLFGVNLKIIGRALLKKLKNKLKR